MKKPKKIIDPLKIIGLCYICRCQITQIMLIKNKAVYLGKGMYRCRSKKCQLKVINNILKKGGKK